MIVEDNRERDSFVEHEISKFLDKCIFNTKWFTDVKRFTNHNDQINGKDIVFTLAEKDLYNAIVDEKAQADSKYIGNAIPTFVLELSFLSKGKELTEGWFVQDNDTQFYLFIWIIEVFDNSEEAKYYLKEENIKTIDYCLVSKKLLRDELEKFNYTVNELRRKSKEIRDNGIFGQIDKGKNKDFYFFFTEDKIEKPVNIVIYKRKLIQMARFSKRVTRKDNKDNKNNFEYYKIPKNKFFFKKI